MALQVKVLACKSGEVGERANSRVSSDLHTTLSGACTQALPQILIKTNKTKQNIEKT